MFTVLSIWNKTVKYLFFHFMASVYSHHSLITTTDNSSTQAAKENIN